MIITEALLLLLMKMKFKKIVYTPSLGNPIVSKDDAKKSPSQSSIL